MSECLKITDFVVDGKNSIVFTTDIYEKGEETLVTFIDQKKLSNAMDVLKTTYEETLPTLPEISLPYSINIIENFVLNLWILARPIVIKKNV